MKNSTWIGNPANAGYYKIEGYSEQAWHAQNVWIQVMFFYGIPAGILYVVMTIATIIATFRKMMENKNP